MPVRLLSRADLSPGSARVVRLDSNDRLVWQVTPVGGGDEFVEVGQEGDVVKAWSWNGFLYRIRFEDGQIISIDFVK